MPDEIVAKDNGAKHTPHPEGVHAARCVDTIDLGERVKNPPGVPAKIVAVCALVFRTGELKDNGEPFDLSEEFTISMYSRANLRQFLESWRGKSYTDEQADQGVPLHKLVGQTGLISVAHNSKAGKTYANIKSIMPLPKSMSAPIEGDYVRAPYWTKRKEDYAKAVTAFRAVTAPGEFEDFPDPIPPEDDDDLPF